MYFSNTWFLKDLFTKGTISKKPLGLTYSCEKQLIYSIGQELKMKMRIKDQIIKYQTIWNKQEWGGKSRSPISGVPSGELRAKMEGKKTGRCGLLHSSYPNCDVTFKGSRWPDKIVILSTPLTELNVGRLWFSSCKKYKNAVHGLNKYI